MSRRDPIYLTKVRTLSKLQCTQAEACAELDVSNQTFRKLLKTHEGFRKAWEDGREQGKVSLRRKQNALAGASAPMAIFLGKQYLRQDDVSKHELTGANGGPIQTFDLSKLDAAERKTLRRILQKTDVEGSGQA